jgi:hypothetical protein
VPQGAAPLRVAPAGLGTGSGGMPGGGGGLGMPSAPQQVLYLQAQLPWRHKV